MRNAAWEEDSILEQVVWAGQQACRQTGQRDRVRGLWPPDATVPSGFCFVFRSAPWPPGAVSLLVGTSDRAVAHAIPPPGPPLWWSRPTP